jgi:sulfate transporter 3
VLPLFFYLPQNCLSAIVVVALTNLMDVSHFFWLLKFDRKDAGLWLTAFLAVLFQGVEIGILIAGVCLPCLRVPANRSRLTCVVAAVCASLGLVVLENFLAPLPELGALVGAKTRRVWRNMSQYPHAERVPGVSVVRVEAPIIFFNAAKVGTRLRSLVYGSDAASEEENAAAADRKTRAVLVDFSNVSYVDSAFLEMFDDLLDSFATAEVLLAVINPNTNVLHKMTVTGLTDRLNRQFDADGQHWVFVTVTDAMDAVRTFEPPLRPVKEPPPEADEQAPAPLGKGEQGLTRRSRAL